MTLWVNKQSIHYFIMKLSRNDSNQTTFYQIRPQVCSVLAWYHYKEYNTPMIVKIDDTLNSKHFYTFLFVTFDFSVAKLPHNHNVHLSIPCLSIHLKSKPLSHSESCLSANMPISWSLRSFRFQIFQILDFRYMISQILDCRYWITDIWINIQSF